MAFGEVANPLPTTKMLCVSGYTATVRPSVSYTNNLKLKLVTAGHSTSEYELDHFIPLELGGNPKSLNNLWLQPWDDARKKDKLENSLHKQMCLGLISMNDAQSKISTWKRN